MAAPAAPRRRAGRVFDSYFAVLTIGLLLVLGSAQLASLSDEAPTNDEGPHLLTGYLYLRTGHYYESTHPPLGRLLTALPLLRLPVGNLPKGLDWDAVTHALWHGPGPVGSLIWPSRLVTVGLTLLFGAWLAYWTRRHFSAPVSILALTLFAFDPNIIAHGRYATTDLIASFSIFLTATLWISFLLAPTARGLVLVSVSLGLALASKYSTLFLLGVLPVLYCLAWARRCARSDLRSSPQALFSFRGALTVCAAMGLGSIGVLALMYAPEVVAHVRHFLSRNPTPSAPFSYLGGLRALARYNTSGAPSYLLGQFSTSGWWYYFPVAFLVKTPTAVLAACVIAAVVAPQAWLTSPRERFTLACLITFPLAYFALAMTAALNLGVRHILPIYAFLYVLLAFVLCEYGRTRFRRWWTATLATLVTLLVIESVSIYPYYTSFFNWVSGGPANGRLYLLDSNVDWGQDLERLAQYAKASRLAPVCTALFGPTSLDSYGVTTQNLFAAPVNLDQVNCVVAVSVNFLEGLDVPRNLFAPLRARQPMARIGYSIYLFDLRHAER